MSSFFSPYSPVARFGAKLADLMILNALFIVTSLPIVTLGASLTALNDTALKLVSDRYESVSATYLTSFRANLKQGIALGFSSAGLLLVVYAWWVVAENLRVSVLVRIVLLAIVILVAMRVLATLIFVFPYQATFENSVVEVLNNSRRMSARHPISALSVLITTLLPVVVTVFYPIVVGWGVVWLLFGFAGVAFANATVFARVFRRYGAD
ncbi:YesL family protein [Aestuariimicrobium ganziense]|uniref:YesL family protein n=1 Tax=Aestuariimicrobium ganziense TaxID=2773677 RepID=UPI001942E625|nr:YesL family protein [Aestuariimicrobium ganziense]